MRCNIHLGFLLPPSVSISIWLISSSGNGSNNNTTISIPQFLLVLIFSLLFLAVQIKFPIHFSATAPTIGLQSSSGDLFLSGLLGATLVASFVLTPSQFSLVYLICLCIAPWSAPVLAALKSCFQAIPIFVVTTSTRWNYLVTKFAEAITAPEQLANQPGAGAADDPDNFSEAEDVEYGQLYGHA